LPEAFKSYISRQEWGFFLTTEVHAKEITIEINKGPSNPSLAKKKK
jgi:hypothetical protein